MQHMMLLEQLPRQMFDEEESYFSGTLSIPLNGILQMVKCCFVMNFERCCHCSLPTVQYFSQMKGGKWNGEGRECIGKYLSEQIIASVSE